MQHAASIPGTNGIGRAPGPVLKPNAAFPGSVLPPWVEPGRVHGKALVRLQVGRDPGLGHHPVVQGHQVRPLRPGRQAQAGAVC